MRPARWWSSTAAGRPVTVSTGGEPEWDTIVWLDHRAVAEAEECTASGHRILAYIGGVMSPEMETPKLLWLKRHLPASWARAGLFLDLADFLTFKASGARARSQCTLTCKWTYLAHESPGWQRDFFAHLGAEDLLERGALPETASPIGQDLGPLTEDAAQALGLERELPGRRRPDRRARGRARGLKRHPRAEAAARPTATSA